MDEIKALLREYRWRVTGVCAGVVLTILLLTIGFWRTLLLLTITALCFFAGMKLDKNGLRGLDGAIGRLFRKR